jgi:hypothetical protein
MSKNIKVFYDTKHKYEYKLKGHIISCTAITKYKINDDITTIRAKARAKCSPEDKFNYRFGCELAKARAKQKLSKKIEKLLIKYSNKNSEKKIYTQEDIDLIVKEMSNVFQKQLREIYQKFLDRGFIR